MTAERGRERETLVRKIFQPSRAETRQRTLLKLSFASKQNEKTKNLSPVTKKSEKREQKQPTTKTKKNKKSCLMHKNLFSSSSKNSLSSSYCAALIETTNGPLLLRGAKRGEDDEQQQKQRSDQRTLRITLKPRPETRRREIRVRGFEYDEERWENQAPAVYQSWEFRVASSRCKRRPPRGEEIRKERESKRNE